jgi:diaminohydroxyphosphoribosylaminopyrimidine deaminase/5-amino-6-(5-phosphoribosylamino)uracil reductase
MTCVLRDEHLMRRALSLAENGRGRTSPNPMVGAVVAREGQVVGEGYHARAGGPHAEVVALEAAAGAADGCDLYVTLEPCCHAGRTPPCTERIIASGIRRVVMPLVDPNPLVSGRGVDRLRAAGIVVEVGLLSGEAARLNEAFLTFIRRRTPFVTLKAAISLDGKIATRTGESRWISNEVSRRRVHELRDQVDAVVAGVGTIRRDDPLLTTRLPGGGKDPIRIIIGGAGPVPIDARVFHSASSSPTWVVVPSDVPTDRRATFERLGIPVVESGGAGGRVDLRDLLKRLGERDITSVMLEGGEGIFTSALQDGLVDKFCLFIAPALIGGKDAPTLFGGPGVEFLTHAIRLRRVRVEQQEGDLVVEAYRQSEDGGD